MDDTLTEDMTAVQKRQLSEDIQKAQTKFERASSQIRQIKRVLKDTKIRYKMADKKDDERLRANIRIRLMVLKGLLYVYHQYACVKGDEVLEKRMMLCNFDNNQQES